MKFSNHTIEKYIIAWTSIPRAPGLHEFNVAVIDTTHSADKTCYITNSGLLTAGSPCVFPFIYRGMNFTGCTVLDNNHLPWCSASSNYDIDSLYGLCDLPCIQGTSFNIWHKLAIRPGLGTGP